MSPYPPPPESPILFEIVQFTVPRRAAAAIDLGAIERTARADGLDHAAHIEASTYRVGAAKARITCRVLMALRLIDAWQIAAGTAEAKAEGDTLLIDCAHAVQAAFDAVELELKRVDRSASSGIGREMTDRDGRSFIP